MRPALSVATQAELFLLSELFFRRRTARLRYLGGLRYGHLNMVAPHKELKKGQKTACS